MKPFLTSLALLLALTGCSGTERGGGSETPPLNIVLFVVDDLGWKDAAVLGSEFYDTPAIDALAASGVRFSRFYAASPVCSPTRASLMTGRHPARVSITNWIGGEQRGLLLQADYRRQLPLEEITLGEEFAGAGYATGYIGKWHLGAGDEYLPGAQGFAWTSAVNRAGQPGSYFPPYRNPDWPITDVPGLEEDSPGSYLTDRLTDRAIDFLEEHHAQPFLLVLSHYAVHTPLQARDEDAAPYLERASALEPLVGGSTESESGRSTTRLRQEHAVYAGMVASVDRSLSRVAEALDSLGVADHTAIVFVSDNGGLSTLAGDRGERAPTANRPLRAGKGWLYEGGIRIPLIIRWPGAGAGQAGTTSHVPAMTTDRLPTLHSLAGLPPAAERPLDGVNLAPLVSGESEAVQERDLFWHFPHYHGSGNRPGGAILSGDLKLVEWFEDGSLELFDLAVDPGESIDLFTAQPAVAEELRTRLADWRDSIGAAMPRPNPDWYP
ncbi:MAG: sulfatase [marine benthic group bacterium]|nr:sulfatase [Gemmatimonadota bacterium]